jgi:hypothetical protein
LTIPSEACSRKAWEPEHGEESYDRLATPPESVDRFHEERIDRDCDDSSSNDNVDERLEDPIRGDHEYGADHQLDREIEDLLI